MRALLSLPILVVCLAGCGEEEPPRRPDQPRNAGTANRPPRLKGRALLEAMFDAFEKGEAEFQGRKLDGFALVRGLLRYPGIDKDTRSVDPEDMRLVERLPGLLIGRYRAPARFDLSERYRMSTQLVSGLVHEHRHIRTMTIDTLRAVYNHKGNAYDPDAPRDYLVQRLAVWTRYVQEQAAPPK